MRKKHFIAITTLALTMFATAAWAEADPVKNTIDYIRGILNSAYYVMVGVIAAFFLAKKQTTQLVSFLVAAIIVGMVVFTPDTLRAFAGWLGSVLTK